VAVASRLEISGGAPSFDLDSAFCYPNPYYPLRGALHLSGLSPRTEFALYDLAGELVYKTDLEAPTGEASWDGHINGGNYPASGVYLYVLGNQQGNKKAGKLAIFR